MGYTSGYMLAGATSVDVTIRGRGGHGAYPQATKDPIVMAAEFVLAVQTIVSRELTPTDPAVVTIGSIHGGTKYNIIPDEVKLQLTIRTYKPEVRQHILDSLARIAQGIAVENGVPDDRAPTVAVNETEWVAPVYNDPALTKRVVTSLDAALGASHVIPLERVMGGEDFGEYGLENHQIPTVFFRLGAIDATAHCREQGERRAIAIAAFEPVLAGPGADDPHRGDRDDIRGARPHEEIADVKLELN